MRPVGIAASCVLLVALTPDVTSATPGVGGCDNAYCVAAEDAVQEILHGHPSAGVAESPVSASADSEVKAFVAGYCAGGSLGTLLDVCAAPEVVPAQQVTPVEVTDGMVLEAFRRVPLPASVLMIQPPEGETLVNFETNFYTVAAPFQRTVRLLGQRVDLDITPARFGWDFGDGTSVSTTGPGSAYPDLEITHVFERKGWVRPRVDTTYGARFRVNGGAWRDVQGTVTMTGSEVGLRVLEATPSLSGQYE